MLSTFTSKSLLGVPSRIERFHDEKLDERDLERLVNMIDEAADQVSSLLRDSFSRFKREDEFERVETLLRNHGVSGGAGADALALIGRR